MATDAADGKKQDTHPLSAFFGLDNDLPFVASKLRARGVYHAAFSAFEYTLRWYPLCLPTVMVASLVGITAEALTQRQPYFITACLAELRDFIMRRPAAYGQP